MRPLESAHEDAGVPSSSPAKWTHRAGMPSEIRRTDTLLTTHHEEIATMRMLKAIAALSALLTLGFAGPARAQLFPSLYDFTGSQYADDFTDLRRGGDIDSDHDVGGTGHSALNFTGRAGAGGDTWLTKWTPGGAVTSFNARCGTSVFANILIHPFNNRKGVGLVTMLNDAQPGDKGLALIVYDNGNTDAVQLARVDPFTGELTRFGSAPLGAAIKEDAWYAFFMDVTVELGFEDRLVVQADLYSLVDPTDPNSDFDEHLVSISGRTPLSLTGLSDQGQVGIIASATGAVVNSSVTNWGAAQGFEGPCSDE